MKMLKTLIVIVSLASVAFATAEKIPFELERLNNQRDREIEKINEIYKKQLELLKVKYTKAGNLDAANQVVAILKSLDGDVGGSLESILKSKKWKYTAGGNISQITFSDGGKARMSGHTDADINWSVVDNQILTIVYIDGNSCRFDFGNLSDLSVIGVTSDRNRSKRYLSPR